MVENNLWTKDDVINRISQLRTRANLSARKLSLSIGRNPAYIVRLESKNDSFDPSISTLLEIIHACNSDVHEFFYHNIEDYKKDQQIIDKLKRLSSEKRTIVLSLLNELS
ncbi:MAG: helix-turn-helix domain-containing protein [Firmicutes bacterium]|nr:helix-turn-helix domain-containing protein [Bacillota bacterium]